MMLFFHSSAFSAFFQKPCLSVACRSPEIQVCLLSFRGSLLLVYRVAKQASQMSICKRLRCTDVDKASNRSIEDEIGIDEVPAPPNTMDPLFNWIKSHQALIQAIVALLILCLPGNLVTLTLYRQIHNAAENAVQINATEAAPIWQNMSTVQLCPVLATSYPCVNDLQNQNDPSEECMDHLDYYNQTEDLEKILCSQSSQPPSECVSTILKENGPALLDHCQSELMYYEELEPTNASWESEPIDYTCHEPRKEYKPWIAKAHFWMEGIGIIVVGIFGTAGNIMTVLVLRRIDSNVTFNKLLMSLGK